MRFYEFESKALTPNPSPAKRERGADNVSGRPQLLRSVAVVKQAARDLRQGPTRSEAILWKALRNRAVNGLKFRRQHPVGPFVIDFYCHEQALAVEVDGPIHHYTPIADAQRQSALESLGVRFVRIPADAVERDVEGAIALIKAAIAALPSPPGRGVRGEG